MAGLEGVAGDTIRGRALMGVLAVVVRQRVVPRLQEEEVVVIVVVVAVAMCSLVVVITKCHPLVEEGDPIWL